MSQFWNGEVLAAPNLITVCVDESHASEISGRLYHGYSQEPQSIENVVQLIRYMADFYDSIRFPESSVILRKFTSEKRAMEELHEKSVEYQQLMDLINSTTSVYGYDEGVMDVIEEDVKAFFAGQKTAQETAALIQNRVQTYVNEKM